MEAHPDITRELAKEPLFELGNHSYLHPHMTKISAVQMREELAKTQRIQRGLTGREGVLFRPPFGEYDPQLVKMAAQQGMRTLMWSVETGDPDPNVSAKEIIREVMPRAKPGSVIIFHMNGRGWHTAEALPTVIKKLRAKGYTFVKVSDALPPA